MVNKKYRVLIIDDELKICRLINALIEWDQLNLELIGFAHDGLSGLEIIRDEKPEIVITDIRMPGLGGVDLIKTVRNEGIETEFLIISGHSEFEYAQSALKMNVVDYLLKPVKKIEINEILTEVSGRIENKTALHDLQSKSYFDEVLLNNEAIIKKMSMSENNKAHAFLSIRKNDDLDYLKTMVKNEKIIIDRSGVGYIMVDSIDKAEQILREYDDMKDVRFLLYRNFEQPKLDNLTDGYYTKEKIIHKVETTSDPRKESKLEELTRYIGASFEILDENLVRDNLRLFFQILYSEPFIESSKIKHYLINLTRRLSNIVTEQKHMIPNSTDIGAIFNGFYPLEIIESTLSDFLSDLIIKIKKEKAEQSHPAVFFINNYMEENYMNSISLEEISLELDMNASYLSNLYKKETNQTFREALTIIRIDQAKELLKSTTIPISEIYTMVGYNDQKHFTTLFRKIVKVKPSEYRKLNQDENILYI